MTTWTHGEHAMALKAACERVENKERERCAQLCEAIAQEAEEGEYYIAHKCAEAIRALSTSTNNG